LLDEEQSTILKLRFQKGMTLKEIGEQFGYTKEAARQKLNHALIQVKKLVYKLE
jgi:RNA polymerase sigma factor (sigma-70 family)